MFPEKKELSNIILTINAKILYLILFYFYDIVYFNGKFLSGIFVVIAIIVFCVSPISKQKKGKKQRPNIKETIKKKKQKISVNK